MCFDIISGVTDGYRWFWTRTIRSQNGIAFALASSHESQLLCWYTVEEKLITHLLPFNMQINCNISKDSATAETLRQRKSIVWDKCTDRAVGPHDARLTKQSKPVRWRDDSVGRWLPSNIIGDSTINVSRWTSCMFEVDRFIEIRRNTRIKCEYSCWVAEQPMWRS